MRWLGHVARIENEKLTKQVLLREISRRRERVIEERMATNSGKGGNKSKGL